MLEMIEFIYEWNEDKNILLKTKMGICFEDVITALNAGKLLSNEAHFNQSDYPHQRLYIVEINNYAYVVPFVFDATRSVLFLKTIYPSRKYTKKFLKGQEND